MAIDDDFSAPLHAVLKMTESKAESDELITFGSVASTTD